MRRRMLAPSRAETKGSRKPFSSNRPTQAGFTLLEILIAIALLGLLTSLAYVGVQFGIGSWRRAEHQRSDDSDRSAVERVLRQALTGAYPRFASPNLADRTIAFDGEPQMLTLITPLPAAIQAGIMAQQRFFLQATDNEPAFMMGWRVDLPASDGGVLPENLVPLLPRVLYARFSYFGHQKGAVDPSWSDAWVGMTTLPELVRVRLWRQRDSASPWLDITVASRTTTPTDCVYDAADFQCRRVR